MTPPPLPSARPPHLPPAIRPGAKKRPPGSVRGWLLAAFLCTLALFVAVLGFRLVTGARDYKSRRTANPVPGEAEFRAANREIIRLKEHPFFGNSSRSIELAARFCTQIEELRKIAISAANDDTFSLSNQRFLTFCQLNADSCVFLVHVPELRRYTDEARTTIAQIAWMIGHRLVQDAGLPPEARLVIGVKGAMNYEAILVGGIANTGDPMKDVEIEDRGFDLGKIRMLYPFFAADSGAAANGKTTASPVPFATLPDLAPLADPTSYTAYSGLIGEDLQGDVFVIGLHQRLWAVMSRHQFEKDTPPRTAEDFDSERTITLLPSAAIRQKDVQLLPLSDQSSALPYLAFDPVFEIEEGETLWIARGKDRKGTTGALDARGSRHGRYSALDGPRTLAMRLDAPADVRGASGSPVIRVKTGLPIGVLLAADNGEAATLVEFEPICVAGRGAVAPLADAAAREKIIGTWSQSYARDGIDETVTARFFPDGTYQNRAENSQRPNSEAMTVNGRWKIENSTLTYFDLQSNAPGYPSGEFVDQIVELTNHYLVFREKTARMLLLRRLAAAPDPAFAPSSVARQPAP